LLLLQLLLMLLLHVVHVSIVQLCLQVKHLGVALLHIIPWVILVGHDLLVSVPAPVTPPRVVTGLVGVAVPVVVSVAIPVITPTVAIATIVAAIVTTIVTTVVAPTATGLIVVQGSHVAIATIAAITPLAIIGVIAIVGIWCSTRAGTLRGSAGGACSTGAWHNTVGIDGGQGEVGATVEVVPLVIVFLAEGIPARAT
jgi:hypothetical protein